MDRIKELEAEIAAKKAELRILKENSHLEFSILNNCKYSLYNLANEVRALTVRIITSELKFRSDGTCYVLHGKLEKIKTMDKGRIKIGNDFIKEISPIIIKYTEKVIKMQEENNG